MLICGGDELKLLLSLDGAAYEMAPGVVVEFTIRQTVATPQRPHGISYALVLRPKTGGTPWVRFDNAHAVTGGGRGPQAGCPRSLAPDGT
jgi:hypothetical protein